MSSSMENHILSVQDRALSPGEFKDLFGELCREKKAFGLETLSGEKDHRLTE